MSGQHLKAFVVPPRRVGFTHMPAMSLTIWKLIASQICLESAQPFAPIGNTWCITASKTYEVLPRTPSGPKSPQGVDQTNVVANHVSPWMCAKVSTPSVSKMLVVVYAHPSTEFLPAFCTSRFSGRLWLAGLCGICTTPCRGELSIHAQQGRRNIQCHP